MKAFASASAAARAVLGAGGAWVSGAPTRGVPTAVLASSRRAASSSSSSSSEPPSSSEPVLKKTPLYDLHVAHGARMVAFAGHSLPLQYADASIGDSHRFTRSRASLFDVSHMVQHVLAGRDAAAFLERLTPSAWRDAGLMQSRLTALLWPDTGGIVDDAVVTRLAEHEFRVVSNGACAAKVSAYLYAELGRFRAAAAAARAAAVDVVWHCLDGSGLVALQGPGAAAVLRAGLAEPLDLDGLFFGTSAWARLRLAAGAASPPVLVTRGGYTGEDGFELAFVTRRQPVGVAETTTAAAAAALLAAAGPDSLRLAGLGARDSLRLEAGMCLYGHDMDDATTPVEAGLSWIIPHERRHATAGFHGAQTIAAQLTPRSKGGRGVDRRRVGLVVADGAPAREGADVQHQGASVGRVTSGLPSPTLGKNIAMAYVTDGLHRAGTELDVVVRGRPRKAVVTKMPFVPTRYHKKDG